MWKTRRPPLSSFVESYIFFSVHLLVWASHVPPVWSQLALSVAFVTSPAKAGPVKARAGASANVEIRVFMTVPRYRPIAFCDALPKVASLNSVRKRTHLDVRFSVPFQTEGSAA